MGTVEDILEAVTEAEIEVAASSVFTPTAATRMGGEEEETPTDQSPSGADPRVCSHTYVHICLCIHFTSGMLAIYELGSLVLQ